MFQAQIVEGYHANENDRKRQDLNERLAIIHGADCIHISEVDGDLVAYVKSNSTNRKRKMFWHCPGQHIQQYAKKQTDHTLEPGDKKRGIQLKSIN